MVFVRDIIFDRDIIETKKPIFYSNKDIKELNKTIIYIKILKSKVLKIKEIQLIKDFKVNKKTPIIIC